MKVFNVILGVFALFGASFCIFFPGLTFLNTGWVVSILLACWGICSLFTFVSNKKAEKSKSGMILGIIGLAVGIALATLCLLNDFKIMTVLTDAIILCVLCAWMFISGVDSIVTAVRMKNAGGSKWWIFTLIMGILILLGAVYGCFHAALFVFVEAFVVGWFLAGYGVRLIASVFESSEE